MAKDAQLIAKSHTVEHSYPDNYIVDDNTEFEAEKYYVTNDVYLREYNHVSVSSDSVIYKNGFLIKESLSSPQLAGYYRFRHLLKKIITGKKVQLAANKKYLLVTDSWSPGHFHWFCEVLPRLQCIAADSRQFTLLLPDTAYTRKIGMESLTLAGFQFEDIVWMNEASFYKIKNLFYVSPVAPSGHMHPQLMQAVRNRFGLAETEATKKIYLSRTKAKMRKVVNENEISTALASHGFETVYGEEMSLSEQVALFSSCKTLIGIHGAGLTNCVFMPPSGNVIELRKKENQSSNVGYWHLADSLQHQYYYVNGVPDADKPLVGGNACNLSVPVQELLALLHHTKLI